MSKQKRSYRRVKHLCGKMADTGQFMPLTCSQNVTRQIQCKIYNTKILDADAIEHHNVQY